jgi:hypothetical protein
MLDCISSHISYGSKELTILTIGFHPNGVSSIQDEARTTYANCLLSNIERLLLEKCLSGIPRTSKHDPRQFLWHDFLASLHANIFEDQLAILFDLLIVEYSVPILRHQHDVLGDLTIAMAKLLFQHLSHSIHKWMAPPMAKVQSTTSF